jgi:hypothetical protein
MRDDSKTFDKDQKKIRKRGRTCEVSWDERARVSPVTVYKEGLKG